MALRIAKAYIDRLTAHITVEACVQEQAGENLSEGPMETFGIDRDALLEIHGPNTPTDASMHDALCKWLAGMHDLALARKRAHDKSSTAVARLAGQVLPFEVPR